MSAMVRAVDYFYVTVKDKPGEAYRLLSRLVAEGVNLLAFHAIPAGPDQTQLVLFPENSKLLDQAAEKIGLPLSPPASSFLVQGDDRLGALAEIHHKLFEARVNVYASSGVTDGRGGYGYVLYVRHEQHKEAARALGV